MAQKIVSFEVAKALKDASYPQECDRFCSVPPKYQDIGRKIAQPTYIDAWLWLWREKGWFLKIIPSGKVEFHFQILQYDKEYEEWHSEGVASLSCFQDPEEAIIKAIDYLVENNLIK